MNRKKDTSSTIVETSHRSSSSLRESRCMANDVKLHLVLKKLMNEKNISTRVLAKDCKIPHSTLASYLAGKKASYNPTHLLCLAEYFKVTTDYLLFEKDSPLSSLNSLPVEGVFEGWLKVKIERAISTVKKNGAE